jgi:hypothetical protein
MTEFAFRAQNRRDIFRKIKMFNRLDENDFKLREAVGSIDADKKVSGEVEIDGAYFGGYVKPANNKENRRDRRLWKNQSGNQRELPLMGQRGK